MSEQINKVICNLPQSFTTAEQKQARDNIGAMVASASSLFYSTSNPSAFISGVNRDSNLSGNGNTTPLGLNTSITIDKYGDSANLTYDSFSLVGNGGTPLLSADRTDIYMSGHAGNASSPYTANYGLQGMHVYGTNTYNHITATATLRYSGGTFVEGDDSAKIKATGLTLHTTADGDQLVDASSVVRWNSYSAATQVVSRSYPYTDAVSYTGLTIYNPYQTYGASIQDPSSTTIGYLVPRYMAPADLGKVLTVVSDDGYKCEWRAPEGGYPEITPMGYVTVYASTAENNYIDLENHACYEAELTEGGSYVFFLTTQSTSTIHSKLILWSDLAQCPSVTIVYEDEAGYVQEIQITWTDTYDKHMYAFDIYARQVNVHGLIDYTTTMCRVTDYPCQRRDDTSYNEDMGRIIEHIEPL